MDIVQHQRLFSPSKMTTVKKEPLDPEVKEPSILTMKDLRVLVKKLKNVAGRWNLLGVQLEFAPGDLEAFPPAVQDYPIQALQELLTRWLKMTKPTLESLAEVIGGPVIGNEGLAKSLLEERADFPSVQANDCDSQQTPKAKPLKLESHDSGYESQASYVSKGSPVASEIQLFPYLDTSKFSKMEVENLQAKLMADADVMTEYFADFVSETLKSFKKRRVSLHIICMHVCILRPTLIPPKRKARKRILKCKSHDKCFCYLACYWSWFNSTILDYLIKREGSEEDKERLTAFHEARMDFLKRNIFEIPPNMYGGKREKNTNELVLKLDDRYSVAETDGRTVLEVKTLLCSTLSIRAELLSVQDGCLQLTFQIPEIMPRPLSNRKKQLLEKRGVVSIVVRSRSGEETNIYPGIPGDVRLSDVSDESPRRGRKRRASSSPPLDSGDTDDNPSRRFSDPDPPRSKSIRVH